MKKLLALTTVLVIFGIAISTVLAEPKEKEPVDSITFIHYKDGKIKPIDQRGKAPTCYKLMGVKWKSFPVDYYIGKNVDSSAISESTNEWDIHTSTGLFGTGKLDDSANFDVSPDGRNEYSYGDYDDTGKCPTSEPCAIAVTRTWYTRFSKQIVEYDVIFDSDFQWGNGDPTKMDWQNIATHETGHGIGLADIYNDACSTVTMYGYSWAGDIGKRTLEQPDIIGLIKLYGA
jgi:hypothetical protein